MKNKVVFLMAILIVVNLLGCQGNLGQPSRPKVEASTSYIEYVNPTYNFSLDIPIAWKEKYIIEETDHGVSFLFKGKNGDNHSLLTILFEPEQEWREFSEALGGVGPFHEIITQDGVVFVHLFPQENPYSTSEDIKEYDSLLEYSWNIIETLRF